LRIERADEQFASSTSEPGRQDGQNLKKIITFFTAATLILASRCLADAQQPKKVARIGFLTAASRTGISHLTEAFLQGLRELGYVEGQNISIEYRWADGKPERLPDLAAELVRLKVDVIVAVVTQASVAAKNATGTFPSLWYPLPILWTPDLSPALAGRGLISPGHLA